MYTRSIDRNIVKKGRDQKRIVGSVAGSDTTDSKYPTTGGLVRLIGPEGGKPVVSNESKHLIVECERGEEIRVEELS